MAEHTPIDEATLKALQDELASRLERTLVPRLREEVLKAIPEESLPPYYDRYVVSEIRRLEQAIERVDQRVDELKGLMLQRFEAVDEQFRLIHDEFERIDDRFERNDKRFERIDDRFERMEAELRRLNDTIRNWILVAVAILGALITILTFLG